MTILIRYRIGWDEGRVYRAWEYKYTADGTRGTHQSSDGPMGDTSVNS